MTPLTGTISYVRALIAFREPRLRMEKLLSCTLGVVISVRFLRFAFDDFESLDLSDNPLFIFLSVVDLRDRVPADM